MSSAAAGDYGGGDDQALALALFVRDPLALGGIVLRGDGPVRDAMLAHAQAILSGHMPWVRVPANVDLDTLTGGLDFAATLASGRPVRNSGLIDSAAGGILLFPMAERMAGEIAAPVAQALDGKCFAAILLDDGRDDEESAPDRIADRCAFLCHVGHLRDCPAIPAPDAIPVDAVAPLDSNQRQALAATAWALGVPSLRPVIMADRAVRGHAALHGRTRATDDDLAAAVRLVLAPRATALPEAAPPPPDAAPEPQAQQDRDEGSAQSPPTDADLADMVLDAATAAIPPDVLAAISKGSQRNGRGASGRAGQKRKSARRGRPLGSRAGMPGQGKRLALVDTLRAAAPWQTIRRRERDGQGEDRLQLRLSDLRIRRFEQRSTSLTIFAVDASGSSAMARLAEAKGAVELLLAEAYVKRSEVALIAFRQTDAELLLPPTRSLTRARRALAALPGGGGTPLAAGVLVAFGLAEQAERAGSTPLIAMLTDGKANVARDPGGDRSTAMAEAAAAAKRVANSGIASVVIDISPRPREEAAALAAAMGGRYLPLPHAGSAAMVAAIESL